MNYMFLFWAFFINGEKTKKCEKCNYAMLFQDIYILLALSMKSFIYLIHFLVISWIYAFHRNTVHMDSMATDAFEYQCYIL